MKHETKDIGGKLFIYLYLTTSWHCLLVHLLSLFSHANLDRLSCFNIHFVSNYIIFAGIAPKRKMLNIEGHSISSSSVIFS